jgi:spoIIIJ-associated protein
MSVYREFTGKTVEEALRAAREAFGVGMNDLDFEILTPGSRGVLGMGAEPARIVAAPRAELGGAAPKRDAAEAKPTPAPASREEHGVGGRDRDRGPRRDDRRSAERPAAAVVPPAGRAQDDRLQDRAREHRPPGEARHGDDRGVRRDEQGPRTAEASRSARGGRRDDRGGPGRAAPGRAAPALTERAAAELAAARGTAQPERADVEEAEASPEALEAGRQILEDLLGHLELDARVELETGTTSRLNVVGDGGSKEALGALIGRKGERLSALQHLVNLMLSRRMGEWTRVLVDVEDYRGRRERQLHDLALRAAGRVAETGKMLQLEPMPALERRWIHIALREHPDVLTQSVGEEPNRRIVVLPRSM